MNILMIGNGFDLAHGLPTQYRDFLHFGQKVEKIFIYDMNLNMYQTEELEGWEIDATIKQMLHTLFTTRKAYRKCVDESKMEVITENAAVNELHTLLCENTWFRYFCDSETYIGENWIDFEAEIARVIQILEEARKKIYADEDLNTIERGKANVLMRLMKTSAISLREMLGSGQDIDCYILRLEKDLSRLIRALEIYLAEFVEEIPLTQKVAEIDQLKIDKVLSFNYTDTYARKYGKGKNIEYNYIHGIARKDNTLNANNMVLGIDEYLGDEEKDKNIIFITFKKYYQRIFKMTESFYFDWIETIQENLYVTYLYIFGHSLDVTDRDVLRKLICNDIVYTKIFFYREYEDDKRNLSKLIKNLVKVIGQDELIARTGGRKRTIEFVPLGVSGET